MSQRLEKQIDALLDGDLDREGFEGLEAELERSPEARGVYYRRSALHALLQQDAEARAGAAVPFPRPERRWRPLAAAAALVLGVAAGALSGWSAAKRSAPVVAGGQAPAAGARSPLASGFGVISAAADARWKRGGAPVQGSLVQPGVLELDSGVIKLELFSGVTVVVEGNAEFELLSPMAMRVERGRVRALVPPGAEGFRVLTAAGELVDLGTEFAIEVTPEHADLQVLDGEVEWHPSGGAGRAGTRLLAGGDTMRWTTAGAPAPAAPSASARRIADIEATLSRQRDARRERWAEHVESLGEDGRLILYLPLPGTGGTGSTVIRAEAADDRWGRAGSALDFSPTGSRVRVDVPGTHRSLTLLCWARIDALDRQFNSLFLTDGHEVGEPHWQITSDGRLFFSVKKRDWEGRGGGDKHIFRSPPIWDPSQSGRWMMIATVYDVGAGSVTHYLDGRPISSELVPAEFLVERVTIGGASIGNWSEPRHSKKPEFIIRNLNGRIDEFALFGAALDAGEIARLYELGRP